MAFDVLTIGDTLIDAFIRLKEARVTCDINDENCMISMRFGDKIPYEFDEIIPGVGNSSNAAVACARLGLSATTRVSVGNDENGKKCIASFEANGVDTSLVLVEDQLSLRIVVRKRTHDPHQTCTLYLLNAETE